MAHNRTDGTSDRPELLILVLVPVLLSEHSLPVGVVQPAQLHAFDPLVTPAAGVAVAVVAEDEASGAASGDGEATDAALQNTIRTSSELYQNHIRTSSDYCITPSDGSEPQPNINTDWNHLGQTSSQSELSGRSCEPIRTHLDAVKFCCGV